LTVTSTGPGWLCQPVVPPGAIRICCVTKSTDDFVLILTPDLPCTLSSSAFVPRACTGAAMIPIPGGADAARWRADSTVLQIE